MTPQRERVAQAALLLRLRELRRQQAEAALRETRAEHARALQAQRDAQQRLDDERCARSALLQAMSHRPDLPRLAACAEARRAQVDDALERAEYRLLDEDEALDGADHALDQSRQALRQALARRDAADQSLHDARRNAARDAERRDEREDPPPARTLSGARP